MQLMHGMPSPDDIDSVLLLLEHQTVQAVARRVSRTQPAVSRRIQRVEAAYGKRLFVREGSHLRPTAAALRFARTLAGPVRALQAAWEGTTSGVADLRLGLLPTMAAHLSVPGLTQIRKENSKLKLKLFFDSQENLAASFSRGELDAVFLTGEHHLDGAIEALGSGDIVLVGPPKVFGPKSTLTTTDSKLARQVAALDYISWRGPRDATFDAVDAFARRRGLVTPTTPEVPHIETLRQMVAAGAGYSILPYYTVADEHERGRVSIATHAEFRQAIRFTAYLAESYGVSDAARVLRILCNSIRQVVRRRGGPRRKRG